MICILDKSVYIIWCEFGGAMVFAPVFYGFAKECVMEQKTVTLRTWEYGVDVVEGAGVMEGKELVHDSGGVEVWRETRGNKDRWYHAVCGDEGEGKTVLFETALKEEFKRGVPFAMLDKLADLMQRELKPYGRHFVKVKVCFGGYGLDLEETVEDADCHEIPILHMGNPVVNSCEDWAIGTCRALDAEGMKGVLRGVFSQRLWQEIESRRRKMAELEKGIGELERRRGVLEGRVA